MITWDSLTAYPRSKPTHTTMTRLEIERAGATLPKGLGAFKQMNDEQRTLYEELHWREYVNSCLVYGQLYSVLDKQGRLSGDLFRYGTAKTYGIGTWMTEQRAIEIIQEQRADFAKAKVTTGVYTDCEGCSYNSVEWHDEL